MQFPNCPHTLWFRDADVTLANEKTAQQNTDQSEDKITVPDPSYLNTFSKCLFPGDENKWSNKQNVGTTHTATHTNTSFIKYYITFKIL